MTLALAPITSGLDFCDVSINQAVAKENDDDWAVNVRYTIVNKTNKQWNYIEVRGCLISESGVIVEDTRDTHDQEIDPGGQESFELTIVGVNSKLLGEDASSSQVILQAFASTVVEKQLEDVVLGADAFDAKALAPLSVNDSVQIIGGSIWKSAPDSDQDSSLYVKLLVQNKSTLNIPKFTIDAVGYDKKNKEIVSPSRFSSLEPLSISIEYASRYAKAKLMNNLRVATKIGCAEVVSVGVTSSTLLTVDDTVERNDDVKASSEESTQGTESNGTSTKWSSTDSDLFTVTLEAEIKWGFSNDDVEFESLPADFVEAKSLWETRKPESLQKVCDLIAPFIKCVFIAGNCDGDLSELFDQNLDEIEADSITVHGVDFSDSNLPKVRASARFSGIRARSLLDNQKLQTWQDENGYLDNGVSFEWQIDGLDDDLDLYSWNHSGLSMSVLTNPFAPKFYRYLRTGTDKNFESAIAYRKVKPSSKDGHRIVGAYWGYAGGGSFDGGYFIVDSEDGHSVLSFEDIEDHPDKETLESCMQEVANLYSDEDDPDSPELSDLGSSLIDNGTEEGDFILFADEGFDTTLLGQVSDDWSTSLKFEW